LSISALVELRLVRPRAAVDVEDRGEAVALQVLHALELTHALVRQPRELDGRDASFGPGEIEVAGRAGVVVERRREQDAVAARRRVP
jgi:hypothetical protein